MTIVNKVFVYGSLKKGHWNNYLLDKEDFLGEATTLDYFALFDNGSFPCAIGEGHKSLRAKTLPIKGEVYSCSPYTLMHLDTLEGYEPNRPHNFYNRVAVQVESNKGLVECYMYLYNGEIDRMKICPVEDSTYVWGN